MYIDDLGEFVLNYSKLFTPRTTGKSCPKCGTTSQEFLNTGFLGCPYCYESLSETVLPVVQRVQNDTVHVGKVPMEHQKTISEFEKLKRDLSRAITNEDYEQAAKLSAQIKSIKAEEEKKV